MSIVNKKITSRLKKVCKVIVVYTIMGSAVATPSRINLTSDSSGGASWQKEILDNAEIVAIRDRMHKRHHEHLIKALDDGLIAVSVQGWIVIKKGIEYDNSNSESVSQIAKKIKSLKHIVSEENKDRKMLYELLAKEQGHPEWTKQIQDVFAEEWLKMAEKHSWWVRSFDGSYKKLST